MGLSMFCLGGALQYFSEDEDDMNAEFKTNLTYTNANNSKGIKHQYIIAGNLSSNLVKI